MCDSEWKDRLGFKMNYSSGGEEEETDGSVVLRDKSDTTAEKNIIYMNIDRYPKESSTDDLIANYDVYGSTPPRTRIKNKTKDWDNRKQKLSETTSSPSRGRGGSRLARSRTCRRNTMDCAILNQMFIEDENKKTDKKNIQLIREQERDTKLSIVSGSPNRNRISTNLDDRTESLNSIGGFKSNVNPTIIESANRFMSVSCRPAGCRLSAPVATFGLKEFRPKQDTTPKLQNRQEFHETFSNLIKLGSSSDKQEKPTKRTISREEQMWQTELQDLIWLELQAWHADRSLDQQDKFLLNARKGVCDLLNEIMNYKFQPKYQRSHSNTSDADSGIATDSATSTQESTNTNPASSAICSGCLSMYCRPCLEEQSRALKQVEILLNRLEVAEALFPSTKSMGTHYPMYCRDDFVGRVKAMCLWYNITRHHRLKLLILGKLLTRLQDKQVTNWPQFSSDSSSVTSSADDSGRDTSDSKKDEVFKIPKVQFNIEENTSTSDSSSSTESNKDSPNQISYQENASSNNLGRLINEINVFNVESLANVTFCNITHSTSPYRKYIENVLKSRGLGKSLSFLHRLHNVVLRKVHLTLEKPGTEEIVNESEWFNDDDAPDIEPPLDVEQEEELRKYGVWSSEAISLGLPSYVPAFIFLSLIPLEVIHEFLRMRLETRPAKPNPLSLEQLLKELREGLTLAMIHRERFNKHISTALIDKDLEYEKYITILDEFDGTVKNILELYLDYVEQWVLVAAPEGHQKSALHDEWLFTKLVCPMISGQHAVAARKFCLIVRRLLQSIGDRLVSRAEELDILTINLSDASGESIKWELLKICRETQALFTVEREKSKKVMIFARALIRDIEHSDFHRDHTDVENGECNGDHVCSAVKESIRSLKQDALMVRQKLTGIIERVQERCHIKHMSRMDDIDRAAVISRSKEILHQGYKFGFEYHKDLNRLLETKNESCKDSRCAFGLTVGVISFSKMWMTFVMERCERGRGLRPRWAAQGLEFLISACDPYNTKHLTDKQFDELKSMMDACISHVIGTIKEPERVRPSPRSRRSSPVPNRTRTPTRSLSSQPTAPSNQKSLFQQISLKEESPVRTFLVASPPDTPSSPGGDLSSCEDISVSKLENINLVIPELSKNREGSRKNHIRDAVNRLDMELESNLRDKNLIGQVKDLKTSDKYHIRARKVNFRWHRGIKIGQGSFGKVYTAVNNSSGELMAMKEIAIQPGEIRAIKRVAEELKIFEGINHKHLVKYFGVEIHREELLIFMELCAEGTLESLIELSGGLFEGITRRYTNQLLSGIVELHQHGVVHRDIKTANIFLTNSGNCLKLGDFGSAVKIQSHVTAAGELQGTVGTQAYMAPEVFTKSTGDGHGRAADIWSLGCVVVEMASGKRPWAQFVQSYQIMFKVGMGESPEIPESLSQEGKDFLSHCFQHDPKDRWTGLQLYHDHFCKVNDGDCECNSNLTIEKELRRSFRKGSSS